MDSCYNDDPAAAALEETIPATGFEPVTSGLGNQRSIQLSYAGSILNGIAQNRAEQVAWCGMMLGLLCGESMACEHAITFRVRYPECDPMGYLHHSIFLQY